MNNIKYDKALSTQITVYFLKALTTDIVYRLESKFADTQRDPHKDLTELGTLLHTLVTELSESYDEEATLRSFLTPWFDKAYAIARSLAMNVNSMESAAYVVATNTILGMHELKDQYLYPEVLDVKYFSYRYIRILDDENIKGEFLDPGEKLYRVTADLSTIEQDDLFLLFRDVFKLFGSNEVAKRNEEVDVINGNACFGGVTIDGDPYRSVLITTRNDKTRLAVEAVLKSYKLAAVPGPMYCQIADEQVRVSHYPLPKYSKLYGDDHVLNICPDFLVDERTTVVPLNANNLN